MLNLHTHFQGDTIDELTSLVEQVCDSTSTEVSTERAAFTSSAAALTRSDRKRLDGGDDEAGRELVKQAPAREKDGSNPSPVDTTVSNQSDPQKFIPKILSPEELKQAEDAFHFDLRSDFDEMYGREEFEEEEHG